MIVTYHIKLFHGGTNRHNGIFMSLLLLVTETMIPRNEDFYKLNERIRLI